MRWVAVLLVLSVLTTPAMAQTTVIVTTNPGITPDNPLYFLDVLLDNLQEWLASLQGPEALTAVKIHILEERLAEAQAMAMQNKTDAMERAMYYANLKIKELEELSQTCPNCAQMCLHATEQAQKVLEECIKRCPEEAKKGLERSLEEVKKAHERIKERVGSVIGSVPTAPACSHCSE